MAKDIIYSSELIEHPIEFGQPGHDKVFIAGWVSSYENWWKIEIQKIIHEAVVLNEKINEELGASCLTVKQIRNREVGIINFISTGSLISAGSFIWINEKLFLLQRDQSAPTDAGLLTGPAGRCDKKVSETITEETNEELLIVVKTEDNGVEVYKLLCFYRQEEDKKTMIALKLRQKESRQKYLLKQGRFTEVQVLEKIKSIDDICFINIEKLKVLVGPSQKIMTSIDNQVVDEVDVSIAFFDKENNTLEIREVLGINLADNWELALIIDGESFNREVISFNSLEEVPRHLAVPTLKYYLDQSFHSGRCSGQ